MNEIIAEFTFDSGESLTDVPVEYETWGQLNDARDNVLLVCHALTGSARVDDWWGDLLGPGRALDTNRYLVLSANVPGSCYGTVGPTTTNPATGERYGPEFPQVTIRDMVGLHRRLLDRLDIRGVDAAIGGSMGGMQVLEWAFYGDLVRKLIPMGVGGRHSSWCIGWSEAQRQAIYADPKWRGGHYDPDDPPEAGLAAARMSAMISYRSRQSFEDRFGRERMSRTNGQEPPFAVESYLRYQGEKLVDRFDANSYVRLTQAMDTHDISAGRGRYEEVLAGIQQPTLVIGTDSDVLYPLAEQEELAELIPNAELAVLESPHGHDAFLIETEYLNNVIPTWIQQQASCPA